MTKFIYDKENDIIINKNYSNEDTLLFNRYPIPRNKIITVQFQIQEEDCFYINIFTSLNWRDRNTEFYKIYESLEEFLKDKTRILKFLGIEDEEDSEQKPIIGEGMSKLDLTERENIQIGYKKNEK